MNYPGNASLAQDIQERILETFQQTLELVEDGSLKEARLGCDFILRLDPMFEPARWLQDRLDSSEGEIVLDDLKEAMAAAGPIGSDAPPAAAELDLEEDEDEIDLPESLDEMDLEIAPEEAAPAQPATLEEPVAAEEKATPEEPVATEEEATPEEPVATEEEATPEGPVAAEEEATPEEPVAREEEATPEEPMFVDEPATTQAGNYDDESAPTPASADEVAAAPVAALDTESERRVQDLLAEGQSAFDRGEYQSAIDAWSRIFLIDIDHPEANERIEAARKLKAEAERTVEEAFHEALGQIERGDTEEGRAGLEGVLEMQPDHLAAREQLEMIDRAPAPLPVAPPPPSPTAEDAPEAAASDSALSDIDDHLEPEAKAPAAAQVEPIPVPKPKKQPKKAAAPTDRKKLLLYVGAALVVLVAVAGWLLISNWSSIFPNTTEAVATEGERPNPIELAEALHVAGQTSTAISQLKRLPPHHELYSEAQALVAQWEAAAAAAAKAEESAPTEADLAEFRLLVDDARAARARNEYLLVDELLNRAAAIQPLDEDLTVLKATADAELEPIRSQVAIFRQGEWERVLRELWRMREEMPESADLNRLMVDSYYNLGVRALQRGDTASASEHFGEALELEQNDLDLLRASKFAQTYQNRPEDLLFRIYVKYLPFR